MIPKEREIETAIIYNLTFMKNLILTSILHLLISILVFFVLNLTKINKNRTKCAGVCFCKYKHAYFKLKDSLVSFPEVGSRKASLRQHRVGGPTSYLIPTTFTDS